MRLVSAVPIPVSVLLGQTGFPLTVSGVAHGSEQRTVRTEIVIGPNGVNYSQGDGGERFARLLQVVAPGGQALFQTRDLGFEILGFLDSAAVLRESELRELRILGLVLPCLGDKSAFGYWLTR